MYKVLQDVADEAVQNARRTSYILREQGGKTEEAWKVFKEGYVYVVFFVYLYLRSDLVVFSRTFHMTQSRYKLCELGLLL